MVKKSFIEIVQGSINQTPKDSEHHIKRGYTTQIDITFNNEKTIKFLFVFNKEFLKIMCVEFLFENKPSLGSMIDMSKELANLTIGHAKVLAQEENIHFKISTPYFSNLKKCKNYNLSFILSSSGYCNIAMFD
ncbi:chemotaxis protein CheX [Helicobacter saguini]|uniref:Chemotaxis protein CheX n=1 Tax=Helicobacter saguini TaxID=1548018 RepID=A0A347VTR4_9HELI|nr:chemotaxis protein CheX [Helicobacter saguini]MWV67468.1 chemotaxis protein CheX [Helicobacter saguini]MWV69819.1 chemotaxis protein CheX [Helicobacter saguini]MWV72963.1 chemotaxis protein CheX [Helicobacter saguini]TLD95700.1 chemotaxis protein CheX [Helicobacter saguini]